MNARQQTVRAAMALIAGAAICVAGSGCAAPQTPGQAVSASVSWEAAAPAATFTLAPVQEAAVTMIRTVAQQQHRSNDDVYAAVLAALTDTWLGERTSPGGPLIICDSYEGTAEESIQTFYARLDQARAHDPAASLTRAVAIAQGNPSGMAAFEAMRPFADVAVGTK